MTRQDIIDGLLLKVSNQPTPEAAQHVLDVGLKEIAQRYDGHSRDELAQVMAVYERNKPAFDEAIANAGVDKGPSGEDHPLEGLADHPDDAIAPDAGDEAQADDELVIDDGQPDRIEDIEPEHRFTTRAEREEHMAEVFGEIEDDAKPPALTEVFGEVGDAIASAEVSDAPEDLGPLVEEHKAKTPKAAKSKKVK